MCVVLHAPDADPSPVLVRSLSKRGLQVSTTGSPHIAGARIIRADRGGARCYLVLDPAAGVMSLASVTRLIERFAPGAVIWAHQPGMNPPIVPYVDPAEDVCPSEHDQSASADAVRPTGSDDGSPNLRIASASAGDSSPGAGSVKSGPVSASDVLNADELDALLAGELPGHPGK